VARTLCDTPPYRWSHALGGYCCPVPSPEGRSMCRTHCPVPQGMRQVPLGHPVVGPGAAAEGELRHSKRAEGSPPFAKPSLGKVECAQVGLRLADDVAAARDALPATPSRAAAVTARTGVRPWSRSSLAPPHRRARTFPRPGVGATSPAPTADAGRTRSICRPHHPSRRAVRLVTRCSARPWPDVAQGCACCRTLSGARTRCGLRGGRSGPSGEESDPQRPVRAAVLGDSGIHPAGE
jgi:hypothetical protein